ncbi:hypothetical protein BDY21DRAFT_270007, partial [Lineolata rhizophorae]
PFPLYQPLAKSRPKPPPRFRPSISQVKWALIGLNTAVFGGWQMAKAHERSGPKTGLPRFMIDNFLLKPGDLSRHRWWTLLTCAFSHITMGHFLFNLVSFNTFANILSYHPLLHGGHLLSLYVGAALMGSFGFLASTMNDPFRQRKSALGASGAVMGVSSTVACLFPWARVYLFGIVPVPMVLLTAGYFLIDSAGMKDPTSTTGHAAHLGGLAFGLMYYFFRIRFIR